MTDTSDQGDRKKILLIPVLVLVLIYAVFSGDESTPEGVVSPAAGTKNSSAVADRSSRGEGRSDVQWPTHSLNAILAHNPFELQDPRVIVDLAFAEAGLSGTAIMKEVPPEEFFPQTKTVTERTTEKLNHLANTADRFSKQFLHALIGTSTPSEPVLAAAVAKGEPAANTDLQMTNVAEETEIDRRRQLTQRLNELQSQPITMIMQTQHGNAALLGSRRVIEGEWLEDGIRVAAIDRAGITFAIETEGDPEKSLQATHSD